VVTGIGAAPCGTYGYPAVRLYDAAGHPLPFAYARSGYVTQLPPLPVLLRPGDHAYVVVAKFRCDTGTRADAARATVTLPGARTSASLDIAGGSGVDTLSLCAGGRRAPGNQVTVSQVGATLARVAH
jgi:hypothetical protein